MMNNECLDLVIIGMSGSWTLSPLKRTHLICILRQVNLQCYQLLLQLIVGH